MSFFSSLQQMVTDASSSLSESARKLVNTSSKDSGGTGGAGGDEGSEGAEQQVRSSIQRLLPWLPLFFLFAVACC